MVRWDARLLTRIDKTGLEASRNTRRGKSLDKKTGSIWNLLKSTRGGTCSERSDKTGREANRNTRRVKSLDKKTGSIWNLFKVLGEGLESSFWQ
jgi:hypothetical protein